jgi:hypothetical protein
MVHQIAEVIEYCVILCMIATILSCIFVACSLLCTRKFARFAIIANIAFDVLWIVLMVARVVQFDEFQVFTCVVSIGIMVWTLCQFARHADFLVAIVNTARSVASKHFGMYFLTAAVILLQICWQLGWFGLVCLATTQIHGIAFIGFVIYAVLTFYWTEEVISSVAHVAIADSTASWYFGEQSVVQSPTARGVRRALTTSFGSISLSSLLLAIVRCLEWIFETFSSDRNAVARAIACVIRAILWTIEKFARFFNYYTMTMIGIYGDSFINSAKRTKALMGERDGETRTTIIVNYNIVVAMINVSLLLCVVVCAGSAAAIAAAVGHKVSTLLGLGFAIGLLVCKNAFLVVEATSMTLLVCFLLEPERLATSDPHLFQVFRSTEPTQNSSSNQTTK